MTGIYARAHYTPEDAELSDLRAARQPQAWEDIETARPTPAQIAADRAEIVTLREGLAEAENALGWAILTGDAAECEIWEPIAMQAARDLETALATIEQGKAL